MPPGGERENVFTMTKSILQGPGSKKVISLPIKKNHWTHRQLKFYPHWNDDAFTWKTFEEYRAS